MLSKIIQHKITQGKHLFVLCIENSNKSHEYDSALNKKALNNLLELICDTYQGVKPAACKE